MQVLHVVIQVPQQFLVLTTEVLTFTSGLHFEL